MDPSGDCESVVPLVDLGPFDYDKAFLREQRHCACDATGCGGSAEVAEISLRRAGEELVGVITTATFLNERGARVPLGRVRFQRID
jgi:hypothetical protein